MNKGQKSKPSYFAVFKKIPDSLKLSDAILIKYGENTFPTVVRNYGDSKHLCGFTVPKSTIKKLENDIVEFELVSKSIIMLDANRENYINLSKIVPNKTVRNFPLYKFKLDGNKLLFWIYAKGNKPIVLPESILPENISKLVEIFGAFVCEGLKARKEKKHLDRLSFSNAEVEQIKWFIETLVSIITIDKKEWNLQILFSEKKSISLAGLKNYWSKTGVPEENISVSKNNTVASKYGVCLANIYNSTLAEVFSFLMRYCRKICLDSKENALQVFRGFSRGDLGVLSRAISFDSEKKEDVILFKKVCKKLNIETSNLRFNPNIKGWWTCYITGRKNFQKILEFDGIRHTTRRRKLIKILLQNKKLSIYKYIKTVSNNANTARKASELLKTSVITARFFLSKLEKEGYLESSSKEKYKVYHLTRRGLEAFKFYNDLESEMIENDGNFKATDNRDIRAC